jgi:hypothetical protein
MAPARSVHTCIHIAVHTRSRRWAGLRAYFYAECTESQAGYPQIWHLQNTT